MQDFVLRQAIEEQLRKIDNLIDRYSQMAAWHHAQAEQARARMVEAGGKLEGIDDFLKEADDVLSATNKTGKLDRKRMFKLLKARGVSVDADEDAESIVAKRNAERFKARRERIEWSDQYDHAQRDADYHDDQEGENLQGARNWCKSGMPFAAAVTLPRSRNTCWSR